MVFSPPCFIDGVFDTVLLVDQNQTSAFVGRSISTRLWIERQTILATGKRPFAVTRRKNRHNLRNCAVLEQKVIPVARRDAISISTQSRFRFRQVVQRSFRRLRHGVKSAKGSQIHSPDGHSPAFFATEPSPQPFVTPRHLISVNLCPSVAQKKSSKIPHFFPQSVFPPRGNVINSGA
jgi:hypothetical protein